MMAGDAPTPYDLGHLYLDVHHALHRSVDAAMTSAGLSLARAKVLLHLAEHGPMNQSALAARLSYAPRSVTDTVDGLERDGLAVRSEDPHDRRARIVGITPAGTAALADVMTVKHRCMDQIFGALDARERAEFAALLGTISTSVQSQSGDNDVELAV